MGRHSVVEPPVGRHYVPEPGDTQVDATTEPVPVDPLNDPFPTFLWDAPPPVGNPAVLEVPDAIARARLRRAADELRRAQDIPIVRDTPPHPVTADTHTELDLIPTQLAHPWRAAARTTVQTGLATLIGCLGLWPSLTPVFNGLFAKSGWPTPTYLGFILAGVALVAGLLARFMAIPEVNHLLGKLKLGAEP